MATQEIIIHNTDDLKNKIYTIRGVHVMLDSDLAEIYGYSVKAFNQQVKNNIDKFDEDFMFQLAQEEVDNLRSNFLTANISKKSRSLPYVFTEQGVYMLMTVLKGELATKQSKILIRMFKDMKQFLVENANIFAEINSIKQHLISSDLHQAETDRKVTELFDLMDKYKVQDKQGIFFQGQIFDAYSFFQKLIQKAQKEIILIDGYVDLSVLDRFSKKNPGVKVDIYTLQNPKMKNPLTQIDIQKFNSQYPTLTVNYTNKMHDRFLIIDNQELYHIGASLKDLGKTCFGFDLLDISLIQSIMSNI